MPSASIAPLFLPFELGPLRLRNRLAMAPMTRGFSPGGVPGEGVAAYYCRRAEGGTGLIITEGTYVGHAAASADENAPKFYGKEPLAGWSRVLEAVHAADSAIMPQLWHVGLIEVRKSSLDREASFRPELGLIGPSGIIGPGRQVAPEMTTEQIAEVIEAFAVAAAEAQRLGFDGVEIHGAHGYLIDQFFWEATNRRSDQYGGSLENRGRFSGEIIAAIRKRTGPDFPILLRISQWKQQDYAAKMADTPQDLLRLLQHSLDAGVSMIHCSQRRFWEPEFPGSEMNLAGWVKQLTGLPTMTVGSVGLDSEFLTSLVEGKSATPLDVDRLLAMFERGDFDMVAIGRALLGDPDWAAKVRDGRMDTLTGFDPASLASLI